jgi:hypothetical protein
MEGPEHAMKCLICGRVSLPGAKLCLDCKAARKRAFDATVTQPLLAGAGAARGTAAPLRMFKPSQSVPDAARRAAKIALAAQAQSKLAIDSPPRRADQWPIIVGAIGMVLVVVVIGSSGHWFGASKSDTFAAVPIERPPAQASPSAASIVRSSTPGAAAAGVAATVPVVANPAEALPPAAATKRTPRQGILGTGSSVREHSVYRSRPIADPRGVVGACLIASLFPRRASWWP